MLVLRNISIVQVKILVLSIDGKGEERGNLPSKGSQSLLPTPLENGRACNVQPYI